MTRALLEQAFGKSSVDLYEDVLKCPREANQAQLRKAYYKQAREYHPDKNQSDETATLKFQAISFAYNYLKNPENREEYDHSGVIPDENDIDVDDSGDGGVNKDWKAYFDLIFGKVMSTKEIDDFEMKYKMSEEEEQDVLQYYEKSKGNMVKCLEFVMLSTERDVERWMEDYIQPAINIGKVPDYPDELKRSRAKVRKKLEKEDKQQSQKAVVDDEETETEESDQGTMSATKTKKAAAKKATAKKAQPTKVKKKKKKSIDVSQDLVAAIRNKRGGGGGNPFAALGARYGVDMARGDPLDDAAFDKIQSKLNKRKGK